MKTLIPARVPAVGVTDVSPPPRGMPLLRLGPGEVRAFGGASTPVIRCVAGSVWLTQEGNPGDVVLSAGERFIAARSGKIVVQSLGDETAQVAVAACGA